MKKFDKNKLEKLADDGYEQINRHQKAGFEILKFDEDNSLLGGYLIMSSGRMGWKWLSQEAKR